MISRFNLPQLLRAPSRDVAIRVTPTLLVFAGVTLAAFSGWADARGSKTLLVPIAALALYIILAHTTLVPFAAVLALGLDVRRCVRPSESRTFLPRRVHAHPRAGSTAVLELPEFRRRNGAVDGGSPGDGIRRHRGRPRQRHLDPDRNRSSSVDGSLRELLGRLGGSSGEPCAIPEDARWVRSRDHACSQSSRDGASPLPFLDPSDFLAPRRKLHACAPAGPRARLLCLDLRGLVSPVGASAGRAAARSRSRLSQASASC